MDSLKYILFLVACAGTGAIAFFISRFAFHKKQIAVEEDLIDFRCSCGKTSKIKSSDMKKKDRCSFCATQKETNNLIQQMGRGLRTAADKGTHKFFRNGIIRIIHVNRRAIYINLKYKKNYPTCIVIDNGIKEEFHSVFIQGASILKFDTENSQANVYLVTTSEIKGTIEDNSPREFTEPQEELEQIKQESDQKQQAAIEIIELKKRIVDYEKGYQQAYEIVADLRYRLDSELEKSKEPQSSSAQMSLKKVLTSPVLKSKTLPFSDNIDFKKQCRLVKRFEQVNSERGCTVTPEVIERIDEYPLQSGDEGFIDLINQNKYVRQTFEQSTKVVAVPLEENDPGYYKPYHPIPSPEGWVFK